MNRLLVLGVLFLIFAASISAQAVSDDENAAAMQQQEHSEDIAFEEWLAGYHLHKDPQSVPDHLKWLQNSRLLSQGEQQFRLVGGFLRQVFMDNPDKVEAWVKSSEFSGDTQKLLQAALWRTGHNDIGVKVFGSMPDWASKPPAPPFDEPMLDMFDVNLYWGGYFASGDTRYLAKIIDLLDESKPLPKDAVAPLVHEGAKMTLQKAVLLAGDDSIRDYVRQAIKTRTGKVHDTLASMLAEIDKKPECPFPTHDGNLCGELVLLNERTAQNDIQTHDLAHLPNKTETHRGERIAISILAGGMQMDSTTRQTNVISHLWIATPGKATPDEMPNPHPEGIQTKIPPTIAFIEVTHASLSFEDNNPPGVYIFSAEVEDKVAHKKIKLSRNITLLP